MGLCESISNRTQSGDELSLDKFVFQSEVGKGGFARVLCGVFLYTKTWYAVKIVNKSQFSSGSIGQQMLLSELHALKRLAKASHPFIANLHFAFHDIENCYFVLDLKQGGNLRYHLDTFAEKRRTFRERDVAIYILCITSALEYIHSCKIIHRDIKPENIVLDRHGFPCLTDFGVCGICDELSPTLQSTNKSGTASYLAPEVFTMYPHGPECDYWSLGIVAYEMLYGKRPFSKEEDQCPAVFVHYVEGLFQQSVNATNFEVFAYTSPYKVSKRKMDSPTRNPCDLYVQMKAVKSSDMSSPHSLRQEEPTEIVPSDARRSNIPYVNYSYEINDDLQEHLRIKLPSAVYKKGPEKEVSHECIAVIQGLLDIRPKRRFGYRNVQEFTSHAWFAQLSLEYASIGRGDVAMKPSFQPGNKHTRMKCLQQDHLAKENAVDDFRQDDTTSSDEDKVSTEPAKRMDSKLFEEFAFKKAHEF